MNFEKIDYLETGIFKLQYPNLNALDKKIIKEYCKLLEYNSVIDPKKKKALIISKNGKQYGFIQKYKEKLYYIYKNRKECITTNYESLIVLSKRIPELMCKEIIPWYGIIDFETNTILKY